MAEFKHQLKQDVEIIPFRRGDSTKVGTITKRMEESDDVNKYYVKYTNKEGQPAGSWFEEALLQEV